MHWQRGRKIKPSCLGSVKVRSGQRRGGYMYQSAAKVCSAKNPDPALEEAKIRLYGCSLRVL